MDLISLKQFLELVSRGQISVDEAAAKLDALPVQQVRDFAQLDGQRALRMGVPEAIFGERKTPEQIGALVERLVGMGQAVLVTRLAPEAAPHALRAAPHGTHDPISRTFHAPAPGPTRVPCGAVAVVCAGTTDIPVAEEAAVTARAFRNTVARLTDVGVAGIHRILTQTELLRSAAVIIVVAGMEGALPSVVGGLVPVPVIAVPTSVGYGASFGGVAALLAMLNSCASGVTVVNIDNGFGAAAAASRINHT